MEDDSGSKGATDGLKSSAQSAVPLGKAAGTVASLGTHYNATR